MTELTVQNRTWSMSAARRQTALCDLTLRIMHFCCHFGTTRHQVITGRRQLFGRGYFNALLMPYDAQLRSHGADIILGLFWLHFSPLSRAKKYQHIIQQKHHLYTENIRNTCSNSSKVSSRKHAQHETYTPTE